MVVMLPWFSGGCRGPDEGFVHARSPRGCGAVVIGNEPDIGLRLELAVVPNGAGRTCEVGEARAASRLTVF